MQTFVVATDLSERGDRAVRRAFMLARARSARLIVVTVVDDGLPRDIADAYAAGAERALRAIAADAGAVPHESRVMRGEPSIAIATLATAEAAQLVIVGIHRQRSFADGLHDTTLQRILRQSPCPVLVASHPASGPYRGILAAVDFSPASAAALAAAASLAPGLPITAVHALYTPYRRLTPRGATADPFVDEARSAERAWRAHHALPETLGPVEIVEGAGHEVLTATLNRSSADLIALGTHARSGFAARILGSFARSLLRDPPADLILAPPD